MISEITEEWDEDAGFFRGENETQKQRIRQIIRYQKSLCGPSVASSSSSSSSSQASSSYSSLPSSGGNGKLLELMKGGASSLRRLFDMDHDAHLSMVSHQSSLATSKRDGLFLGLESVRSGGRLRGGDVLDKVSKPKLFSRLQRVPKWSRWRKYGLRLRFKRLRIRICWSKH